jgi:rhodanese-related sulfurtransferase
MASVIRPTADRAIQAVLSVVNGLPAFLAGSAVAADTYSAVVGPDAYSDVDVFCSSQNSLIAAAQRLISAGWVIDETHERVWTRWLEHGFNKWHTNSLKLTQGGIEVNVIYKLVDGHPTTSLSQVIESFDFGFLAIGIDARDGLLRDMRSFFYPGQDLNGPLPLLPIRRTSWRNGFISQYQGLREVGRYVKYHDYGYDLTLVREDLLVGYVQVSNYLLSKSDKDKLTLGSIYQSIAIAVEDNDIAELRRVAKEIATMEKDNLDSLMEGLE